MTPFQAHRHWEALSRAAAAPTVTCVAPGVQLPGTTGWQGCGVRVPDAAWVAAFTCGLLSEVHWPKAGTLAVPVSVTTPAAARAETLAALAVNVAGAVPNEHCSFAPVHTRLGMVVPSVTQRHVFR
jgi:hypothetical protein